MFQCIFYIFQTLVHYRWVVGKYDAHVRIANCYWLLVTMRFIVSNWWPIMYDLNPTNDTLVRSLIESTRCRIISAIPGTLQQFQRGLWAKIKSTEIEWKTFIFEVKTLWHIITNFHPRQSFFSLWWRFWYVVKSPLRRLENKCSLTFLVILS